LRTKVSILIFLNSLVLDLNGLIIRAIEDKINEKTIRNP
jgi:hypothetical protein